jgi:hypothetical protein
MKGFIEAMLEWYPPPKKKNPDQLELPLDETEVPKETQET